MKPNNPNSFSWLLTSVREDYAANRRQWSKPGFHAIVVYRFGVWARRQEGLTARMVRPVYVALFLFIRNFYSVELPTFATIGRRLRLPHPAGVVVGYKVEIGDDCVIRQNVTIGSGGRRDKDTSSDTPKLGNGVEVGAGAVIAGGVTVGDGARIGPNAIVMTDVPPGASAFASPAKIMKPLRKTQPADADHAFNAEGDHQ